MKVKAGKRKTDKIRRAGKNPTGPGPAVHCWLHIRKIFSKCSFSEGGSSRSMRAEVCSTAAEHTGGPWGTGQWGGSWRQVPVLGGITGNRTLLLRARALVSQGLSDFTTPKLWPGALLP